MLPRNKSIKREKRFFSEYIIEWSELQQRDYNWSTPDQFKHESYLIFSKGHVIQYHPT